MGSVVERLAKESIDKQKIAAFDQMQQQAQMQASRQQGAQEYQDGLAAASRMDAYMNAIGQQPMDGVMASRLVQANPQDAGMVAEAESQVLSRYRAAQNQEAGLAHQSYADQYRETAY